MEIPPRTLVAGMPAKIIRPLTDEEIKWKTDGTKTYQHLTIRSRSSLKLCAALSTPEPNRKRIEAPNIKSLDDIKKSK
jgi:phenylacetic acid degradation protein